MAEEIGERMAQEEKIKEKVDEKGNKWIKLYFGAGAHFRNWLSQIEEIYGRENIEVEEMDPTGFRCFEEGQEQMYRIWVKENAKRLMSR
jgi:hypothetical protein